MGVVIVTHDRADLALSCAQAVLFDVDASQVVVVVNRPDSVSQADLDALRQTGAAVVLNETRAGYGANANTGARQLPRDLRYLLILNDDASVHPGAISALRNTAAQPDVGLVGAQLVDEHDVPQPSWHRFPTLSSELLTALMLPAPVERLLRRGSIPPSEGWPVGAALLVRAAAFNEVGGFDERYYLYSEELDLAYRLHQHEWKSSFCPAAIVRHIGAQSTQGRYERTLGISRWRYFEMHWSRGARLTLAVLLPVVYAWNALYVAVRVIADPGSAREKTDWWRRRWTNRPLPDLRGTSARDS